MTEGFISTGINFELHYSSLGGKLGSWGGGVEFEHLRKEAPPASENFSVIVNDSTSTQCSFFVGTVCF